MPLSIEERKIKLREDRLKLKEAKFKLAESAASAAKDEAPKKTINPIIATIIVAIIGFIATTVGTIVNNSNANKLESRKFEFDLIKKGLEQPSQEERVKFLTFLSKLKLIKDYDMTKALDSVIENPNEVPYLVNTQNSIGSQPIKINANVTEKSFRLGALVAARGEIGQREDDKLANGGPAVAKYMLGGQGVGWQVGFISWCYSQNVSRKPPFTYAYTGVTLKQVLIKNGWWVPKGQTVTPRLGDIYLRDFGNGRFSGGIVDSVINTTEFIGIEGNSSPDGSLSGKMVCKHKRKAADCNFGQID